MNCCQYLSYDMATIRAGEEGQYTLKAILHLPGHDQGGNRS